jgi:anti-anti-sigma regulatory factor
MAFQWDLSVTRGVTVLALRGRLDELSARRFVASVGWACAHSRGPLVLDLTGVQVWSAQGRDAVDAALAGWHKDGREVVVCLPPGQLPDHPAYMPDASIRPDLNDAIEAADRAGQHAKVAH